MDTPRWAQILNIAFPTLSREGFQIVAQPSDNYNCIAYAAGDFHNWWDYGYGVSRYWPPHAARSSAIENLVEIFAGLGFERCDDGNPESGYQKVALYEQQGLLKHAAVQQPNGRWRSKMGAGPLIEHLQPRIALRRPIRQSSLHNAPQARVKLPVSVKAKQSCGAQNYDTQQDQNSIHCLCLGPPRR